MNAIVNEIKKSTVDVQYSKYGTLSPCLWLYIFLFMPLLEPVPV